MSKTRSTSSRRPTSDPRVCRDDGRRAPAGKMKVPAAPRLNCRSEGPARSGLGPGR